MVIASTIELTAAGGQQFPSRQFMWPSRFVRHAIALSLSVNLGKSLGRIANMWPDVNGSPITP